MYVNSAWSYTMPRNRIKRCVRHVSEAFKKQNGQTWEKFQTDQGFGGKSEGLNCQIWPFLQKKIIL